MKKIFRKNPFFFIPTIIIWFLVLGTVLSTSKFQQMQFINSRNSAWADKFFWAATQMGEGWFWVAIILIFLWIEYGKTLVFVASLTLSTVLSTSAKFLFNTLRPVGYFKDLKVDWHFVEGVYVNYHLSFPSGHTTTAFAIFTLLALFIPNKNWGWLWMVLAWLTGYSRCYLFQHFPEDVLGGVVIGIFSSLVVYFWLLNIYKKNPKNWHGKRLLSSGE